MGACPGQYSTVVLPRYPWVLLGNYKNKFPQHHYISETTVTSKTTTPQGGILSFVEYVSMQEGPQMDWKWYKGFKLPTDVLCILKNTQLPRETDSEMCQNTCVKLYDTITGQTKFLVLLKHWSSFQTEIQILSLISKQNKVVSPELV